MIEVFKISSLDQCIHWLDIKVTFLCIQCCGIMTIIPSVGMDEAPAANSLKIYLLQS